MPPEAGEANHLLFEQLEQLERMQEHSLTIEAGERSCARLPGKAASGFVDAGDILEAAQDGHVAHQRHGTSVVLCARLQNHARSSWVGAERSQSRL